MRNETVAELENYTDFPEFERLCADILTGVGYRGIDPQGIEGKDGGKDALHMSEESDTVFHFSTREDWKIKLFSDLDKVRVNGIPCSEFVFVSNREVSGMEKDELKEEVQSEYGWELEIFDVERLRIELDNHRQELRKKYLGIPLSQASHVDETLEELIEKRKGSSGGLVGGSPCRILLAAVPNSYHKRRMGLFDDRFNFVADQDYLDRGLSTGLPSSGQLLESQVRSDHYANTESYDVNSGTGMLQTTNMFAKSSVTHEYCIYDSGTLEGMYDTYPFDLSRPVLEQRIRDFLSVLLELYRGKVRDEEHITLGFFLLNAKEIGYEKNGGEMHSGEEWLFQTVEQERMDTVETDDFQEVFLERTLNRVDNFFNQDVTGR